MLGLRRSSTWIVIAVLFRYSSLAAVVRPVFAPLCYFLSGPEKCCRADPHVGAAPLAPQTNILNLVAA